MKKINFRLLGLFVVLLSVFSNQVVFAEIVIRKDDDSGLKPNIISTQSKTYSLSLKTVIPVSADVVGTDLIVDFSTTVGTAFVSIVDKIRKNKSKSANLFFLICIIA